MQRDPGDHENPGGRPRWSGRTKRLFATGAAAAVLLGSGTVIGVALTGGASASTSPTSSAASASTTPAPKTTSPGSRTSRCAKIVQQALDSSHPKLASRIHALCTRPLLRLALVGGEHGEVTFRAKSGTTTLAFERGTVKTDSGGVMSVIAADGTDWTWDITSSTVVRQGGSKVTSSAIASGDHVLVAGTAAGQSYDARVIRIAGSSASGSS